MLSSAATSTFVGLLKVSVVSPATPALPSVIRSVPSARYFLTTFSWTSVVQRNPCRSMMSAWASFAFPPDLGSHSPTYLPLGSTISTLPGGSFGPGCGLSEHLTGQRRNTYAMPLESTSTHVMKPVVTEAGNLGQP